MRSTNKWWFDVLLVILVCAAISAYDMVRVHNDRRELCRQAFGQKYRNNYIADKKRVYCKINENTYARP